MVISQSVLNFISVSIGRSYSLTGQLLKNIVHGSRSKLLFQSVGSIKRTDYTVHHDRNTVAILRLIHKMGCDKNSDTLIGSLINQLPKLAAGGRIDTARRFIQKNNLGMMKNGDLKSELLFRSQRQVLNKRITLLFQSQT